MTVTENKIALVHFDDMSGFSVDPAFFPYDADSLIVTVSAPLWDEDDNTDRSFVYIASVDGEIEKSLELPFGIYSAYALDDGNIGIFHKRDEQLIYSEYSPELEFLYEKTVPFLLAAYSPYLHYSDGLFYGSSVESLIIFNRDFEILETIPNETENLFLKFFFRDTNGAMYLYKVLDTDPSDDYKLEYYISPLGGVYTQIMVSPDSELGFMTPRQGDSEYPFYAKLRYFGFWNQLFDKNVGGNYLCGLRADGTYETILEDEYPDYAFDNGIPINGKRYAVISEKNSSDGSTDIYLCEYTAVYED